MRRLSHVWSNQPLFCSSLLKCRRQNEYRMSSKKVGSPKICPTSTKLHIAEVENRILPLPRQIKLIITWLLAPISFGRFSYKYIGNIWGYMLLYNVLHLLGMLYLFLKHDALIVCSICFNRTVLHLQSEKHLQTSLWILVASQLPQLVQSTHYIYSCAIVCFTFALCTYSTLMHSGVVVLYTWRAHHKDSIYFIYF